MEPEEITKAQLQSEIVCEMTPNVCEAVPISQPIEEMLGSVTTYNNIDGTDVFGSSKNCQQLRTSARVFKKMKLDSALAVVTTPIPEKEKKDVVKDDVRSETKKPLRPSWSVEDKDLFFEGLNEYGKDFDAIQQHINNKYKKKGLPESVIKTKDQVRHFYYRTWHKVSKHLKFSEDIKKIAQELYALINYGEIRKKLGSVSEKVLMKLNELIYRGAFQIRSKGKTIRIKTPMCRALRRLNQLDEKHEDLKLPVRVLVELRPKNMESWLKVQFMAQNPRIRISLPLQRRLSALMSCINDRWRTQIAKAHENVLNSINNIASDCASEEIVSEEQKALLNPQLRFAPKSNASIQIPTINLSEYLTSHRICLNAYEERIGVKVPGQVMWQNMCASFKGGGRGSTKKGGSKRIKLELGDKNGKMKENCDDLDCDNHVADVVDMTVNTILSLQKTEAVGENALVKEEIKSDLTKTEKTDVDADENKVKETDRIRSGWTLEDSGSLTIGELYLMFGHDSKLELEYSWDPPNKMKIEQEETTSEETNEKEQKMDLKTNDLSVTLKKLLSVAKLHYRKEKINCPCGHICGGPKTGPNSRNKSLAVKTNQRIIISDQQDKNGCIKNTNNNETKNNLTYVSQQSCMRNVSVKQDSVFRRPNIYMGTSTVDNFKAQLDSLQRMKPRYCNRRGRPVRSKQVVVERMLPLLPKPPVNGHSIVTMKVISQSSDEFKTRVTPRPIAPRTEETVRENDKTEPIFFKQVPSEDVKMECSTAPNTSTELDMADGEVSSSTTISNFLNLDIPTTDTNDLILSNATNCDKEDITSFAGLLSDEHAAESTPLSSPSRILKENDIQWLNSEVNDDYSLTSLLGHLESPMKNAQATIISEDTVITQDIDAQFPSLLGENGVDFVEQFVDMAAQVNCECSVTEQVPNT